MTAWDDKPTIAALIRRLAESAWHPPDRITPSQWAEQRRALSPEASAKSGGRFTFDLAPWQREVLDSVIDPGIGSIVLMWASQVTGKTETINNIVGYQIDVDPCPILVLQPTGDMAETWSKDRLVPMIRDTPALNGKVRDPRSRDSGNTILHKKFPGGHITIVGTNSPAQLAMRPIRLLICDEVDRYPLSAGEEGDPVWLAQRRTTSYKDAISIKTSTPTEAGVSRIEKEFLASDQRKWFCPCPKCGKLQTLEWENVRWEKDKPDENWLECTHCHEKLTDEQRQAMVRAGEWRATMPFNGTRGYHMNGIYCLFPPQRPHRDRMTQMIKEFLEAKRKGKETLKAWINTFKSETHKMDTDKVDMFPIMNRRENWGVNIPAPICLLTLTCDVQADRIEGEIVGWGDGEESWGIERFTIFGNPLGPSPWVELDKIRSKKYTTATGAVLQPSITGIDSGGNVEGFGFAQSVYDYVLKRRQATRGQPGVIAVKGSSTVGAPLAAESMQKNGVNLLLVGTDRAKSTIMERLKLPSPSPGYMHFPHTYNEDFFQQLGAEELRTVGARRQWVKTRDRNEALDIRVYSIAVLDLLSPDWDALGKLAKVPARSTVVTSSNSAPNPARQTVQATKSLPKHPPRMVWRRR
jgi:phage terminase large subunit GpA-like protein